jgi:glycosyltransferase involved in cell wall biosynthesis
LPEEFIFMPNQFYKHKNHELVVRALQLVASRGKAPVVFASGAQLDSRNPDYPRNLVASVARAGLSQNFVTPGQIPYAHVLALMRACSAFLNPSLCEGWSTTVEEARALGVPMHLSDLDVHKEQAGTDARYFDRYSVASLATCLESVKRQDEAEREQRLDAGLLDARMRSKRFAAEFMAAAHAACAASPKR